MFALEYCGGMVNMRQEYYKNQKNTERIGIVVLNYINFNETINCVNSLLRQTDINVDIVIVDNGSQNESSKILSEKFKNCNNISLIISKENLGYAKGNNIGIQELRKRGISDIFIANSDLIFNSVHTMAQIKSGYEKGVGVVVPIIKNTNGTVDERVVYQKKYLYLRIIRKVLYVIANRPFPNKPANKKGSIESNKKLVGLQNDRYVIAGSGFLLTKDFFDIYTGLYPNTFLYFEEWATILLLHKSRLKTKITDCDYITHKGAASTPTNIKNVTQERKKIMNSSALSILKLLFTPSLIVRRKY